MLKVERLETRDVPSVSLGSNFQGLDYNASGCGCYPPDGGMAVGTQYIIQPANLAISFYDKAGTLLFRESEAQFFSTLGSAAGGGDGVALYDEFTGRFIVADLAYDFSSISALDFAISNDSNPFDGWTFERYDMNDKTSQGGAVAYDFADFPKVGYNADGYVFSFNMFPYAGFYDHVDLLAIDKATLTGVRTVLSGGYNHFTLAPATEHGAVPGDPMWFVEDGPAVGAGSSTVYIDRLDSPFSATPVLSTYAIPIDAYSSPNWADQPGRNGRNSVNVDDARYYFSVLRNGSLVAAHTAGDVSTGIPHARWYEFNVAGAAPVLVQEGVIAPKVSNGKNGLLQTYYPSVEINAAGDIGITYMGSNSRTYVSMYVTIHGANDAPGTTEGNILVKAGEGQNSFGRAGDYSFITIDPVDGSFWAENEYAPKFNTGGYWSTWIANFHWVPSAPILVPDANLIADLLHSHAKS